MSTRNTWRRLDPAQAKALTEARLELHWAAQIASAAGATLRPTEEGFAHTNLGWSRDHDALVGRRLGQGLRAALRPHDLTLLVVGGDGSELEAQALAGRTLAQGLRWLAGALARQSDGALEAKLERPAHALPDHPVAHGAAFTEPGGALAALGDWLADAHCLLVPLATQHPHASEVRCWPHHFDIATLVTLDPDVAPGEPRTVGVGMTPGDERYPEPYFYATPWPAPESPELPELPSGGVWHRDGWLGAVLVGSKLLEGPDAQRAQAEIFLDAAFAACQGVLRS